MFTKNFSSLHKTSNIRRSPDFSLRKKKSQSILESISDVLIFYRFLCSSRSVAIRAWSNVRVASRIIPAITLVVGLLYIYIPIQNKTVQVGRFKCPSNQSNPPAFQGAWSFIIYSMGPPIVMLIFGSLTIRHVQQSITRLAPLKAITHTQNLSQTELTQQKFQPQKMIDQQLIKMMIVQCV